MAVYGESGAAAVTILDAEGDATVGFIDEWFSHQGGRRGVAQRRTPTGGLLWARTRHAATMVGRLAGAAKAVEMGYAIEADHGPSGKLDHWAIASIPSEVTEHFSKRSAEIDAAMEAEEFSSYRAPGIAARATRNPKADESPESLILRWYDELDSIGWPARKIAQRLRIVQDRSRRGLRSLTERERTEIVQGLIGPDGPLAARKAFTRADVIRLAAPALYGCAPEELDRVVSGVVHHPRGHPPRGPARRPGPGLGGGVGARHRGGHRRRRRAARPAGGEGRRTP